MLTDFVACSRQRYLLELMFRYWDHPLAADSEYRDAVLESTTSVLDASINGQCFFEELDCRDVNFVAAVYFAEAMNPLEESAEAMPSLAHQQAQWMERVRKALPSCFCPPQRSS